MQQITATRSESQILATNKLYRQAVAKSSKVTESKNLAEKSITVYIKLL